MSEKPPCGFCPANDNMCPVCLDHLCEPMLDNDLCGKCKRNPAIVASLPKTPDGKVLNPVTFGRLTMCNCGLVWNSICGFHSVSNEPGNHRRLGNK